MIVRIAHYLQSFPFLPDVVEDKFFALVADVGDPTCQRHLLLEPLTVFSNWSVFWDELVQGSFNVEFVGVGIGGWVFLEFSDHLGTILKVSGWVEDLLYFYLLLFTLFLLSFFRCLLGLLSLQLFQLLKTLLLIFTELLAFLSSLLGLLFMLLNLLGFFVFSMFLFFVALHYGNLDKRKISIINNNQ